MNKPVHKHSQMGVSLIEALIALIVLSIGLLGVLMLQTKGLSASQESIHRQTASMLASDLLERIEANRAAVTNASGNQYVSNFATGGLSENVTCGTTGCTDIQMAITDIVQWKASLVNSLPGAESSLCFDSSPNDGSGEGASGCGVEADGVPMVIKIWWDEKLEDGSTVTRRYTVSVENIEGIQ
jgi:type IV pilus assembly protein PilV